MSPEQPAVESAKRMTRSSARSQTLKMHNAAKARKNLQRTKSTERINKHRTKSRTEPTKAKFALKQTPEQEQEPSNKAEAEVARPDTVTSTPDNVTIITIDSELVKKPIMCHQYTPTSPPLTSQDHDQTPLIFTHGAGGTLSTSAVVHFCNGFASASSISVFAFQGSMNLGARIKSFHACHTHVHGELALKSGLEDGVKRTLVFGGRSMGARAAVIAATEHNAELRKKQQGPWTTVKVKLVLVSYPLKGPKDLRDQILLDLPRGVEVLFVVGDRDVMCPLELLEEIQRKIRCKSRMVVVRGADHGMNIKPANRTKEVGEETGRVAARWLSGEIEVEGEVVYLGKEY